MSNVTNNRRLRTSATIAGFVAAVGFATSANATLVISKKPTSNVNCSTNYCTATAANAVMNADDLSALLKAHDQWLDTGHVAGDIVFRVPFRWSNAHVLSLIGDSVIVEKQISVLGKGGLSLQTSYGAGGGELIFRKKGKIDFWDLGGSLSINSQNYVLVGDVTALGQIVSGGFGHIALARDYDAVGDGVYSTSPGTGYFQGNIEGLGHTMSNLSVNDPVASHYVGLISYLRFGSIRNIGLVNANITGGNQAIVGGIAGEADDPIENTFVTGNVSGGSSALAGGLVGIADDNPSGWIRNSYSTASVTGGSGARVGGLVGDTNDHGVAVSYCFASGPVTVGDNGYAGGLVGFASGGDIDNSYATGPVLGTAHAFVGGLAGYTSVSVEYSYSKGPASGGSGSITGGFVGYVGGGRIDQDFAMGAATGGDSSAVGGFAGSNQNGDIRYVYALGSASVGADGYAGGLLGQHVRLLSYSFATGAVSGQPGSTIGGVVGIDYGHRDIFATYWDTDTSGISNPDQGAGSPLKDYGVNGLTTDQFLARLPKGFDRQFWRQNSAINNGLPYLRALPPQ